MKVRVYGQGIRPGSPKVWREMQVLERPEEVPSLLSRLDLPPNRVRFLREGDTSTKSVEAFLDWLTGGEK